MTLSFAFFIFLNFSADPAIIDCWNVYYSYFNACFTDDYWNEHFLKRKNVKFE